MYSDILLALLGRTDWLTYVRTVRCRLRKAEEKSRALEVDKEAMLASNAAVRPYCLPGTVTVFAYCTHC